MDASGAPRRIGVTYCGPFWYKKPRNYEGLWANIGCVRTKQDGSGRTVREAAKGDVEARVGIEPAYTALQAAA